MIKWKFSKDNRPKHKQSVFITVERGLISNPIIGPIYYDKDADSFIDLFTTPEEGASYSVESHDLWWCEEEEINLPGDDGLRVGPA
jgi:hypothetical protein